MKKLLIVLPILAVLFLSACNIKPTDKNALGADGAATSLSFDDEDLTNDAVDKMNTYIDVRNDLDPKVNDSLNAYLDWAERDSGPILAKVPADGDLQKFDLKDKYLVNAESSLATGPKLKFDSLATKYILSLKKLIIKNNELYDYYHNGDYKKDALAKGKTLHKEFTDIISEYDDTYPEFIDNYDQWFLALQLDNMRYYKQEGETAKYAVENISLYKKYVMNEVDKLDKAINKNKTVNADELTKYVAKYDEAVKYINDQNDKTIITNDLGAENVTVFEEYKQQANDLQKIVDELLPLIKDYDKVNLDKINELIDKAYDIEEKLIELRNKTIK